MGDSDDEYDRRRRDKFRRERSDYDRSREREERRRDDWSDREWDRGRERRSRGEYRDYDRSRRERFSPPRHEMSPPQKRMRRDWDDHSSDPYHSGYDMQYSGASGAPSYGPPQPWAHPDMHVMQHHGIPIQARLGNLHDVDLGTPAPVMKTFKEFLLSLEDSVDETEAVRRYNEYKMEFRRQQMQDFFLAHKDEEWFRSKYHPDEVGRHRQESQAALRNRLNAFLYLMENSWMNELQLDMEKAPAIIKMLDAAVIKMEGGTEIDMKILDEEEEQAKREAAKKEEARTPEGQSKPPEEKESAPKTEPEKEPVEEEKPPKPEEKEEEKKVEKEEEPPERESRKSTKRKRKRSGDSDDGSDSESGSGSEPASPKPESQGQNGRESPKKEKEEEEEEEKPKEKPKEEVVKPRPLHKTCSLFIRNVAPNISKAEITALCKRYPGFLRVALSDPQPERRFLRKGYVTFDRGVNIKEICWNLQNIRLRECELSPVVNRELSWRIRHVSGITQHRPVLRNDIKLAARLIHALDERGQLWKETQDGEEVSAQNPILKNITDYLIDEVSAEEEDLLWGAGRTAGTEPPKEGNPTEISVERDEKLIKVLDKLLLYLRIVHSVDYYINCDYPSEDEMPTRCGIMHVRGPIPPNRVSHREVADWQKTCEEKLAPLFAVRETLSEEEALKVGKKDPEQEVEKFVTANTQELGKEKWLCPLSGKKFKGPEFVRKHIFNKHAEKIEEVKKEVVFFNNFLMDSKRPALPEVKPIQPPIAGQGLAPGLLYPHQGPQALLQYGQPRPPVLGYGGRFGVVVGCLAGVALSVTDGCLPSPPGAPQFPPNPYGAGRGYDAFRGQGGVYPGKPRNRLMRGDPRSIIEYRDLDAPEDVDFF
ncbi:serrate RNA effector molecule homolog isoform X2 [Bufo bufo]|uniref:serrate RNA effector molecule homolog isoform X2 n=1 Tax=Bufo bufo TaxID=8384 RepID=UPI001ABE96CE|nr:serrate RNA effector molecule homolog isoform X2 [Bufo bufo]